MARLNKSSKKAYKPDFAKKRNKVGKYKKKPDNYTDTTIRIKYLRQVKQRFSSLDHIFHQVNSYSGSIRRNGYQQLYGYMLQNMASIGSNSQLQAKSLTILNIVFKGLNSDDKNIYTTASGIFSMLPQTGLIERHLKYFRVSVCLILNSSFLDNRYNFIGGLSDYHLDYLSLNNLTDFLPCLSAPDTEDRALDCCLYLLGKEHIRAIWANVQTDYFDVQTCLDDNTSNDVPLYMVRYIIKNKILSKVDVHAQDEGYLDTTTLDYPNTGNGYYEDTSNEGYYITSFRYLKLLFKLKKIYNWLDKEYLCNVGQYLKFPMYHHNEHLMFNLNAYLYLLTDQKTFDVRSQFQYENQFDLERILNCRSRAYESVSTKEYIEQQLLAINNKNLVKDTIYDLLVNNKIGHKYLSMFDNKVQILTQCSFFSLQTYFDEVCRLTLKKGREEMVLRLVNYLITVINERQINGEEVVIDNSKFNSMTVNGQEVCIRHILSRKLGNAGIIRAFCGMFSNE